MIGGRGPGAWGGAPGPCAWGFRSRPGPARFDVTTTSTVKAFHHYSVGGELEVEDTETVSVRVDSVECRWCGPSGSVEELAVTPPA